jgi:type IV pilus assembly protein PilY1
MTPHPPRLLAATLLAAQLATPSPAAMADRDEAWVGRAEVELGARPLLALLVDTSVAMERSVEVPLPYDPARLYPGECRADRIYWQRGSGPVPDCAGGRSIALASADPAIGWRCGAGSDALAGPGYFIASRAAQWESRPGGGYWREPRAGSEGAVECRADSGRHGSAPGAWFAVEDGTAPWGADPGSEVRWDAAPLADPYVFYSGNYLNYRAQAIPSEVTTLLEWTLGQLSAAASATAELDVALARLSHDGDDDGDTAAEGGMVVMGGSALPAGSERIARFAAGWVPAGPAPLGEAAAELGAWISGQEVHYGETSHEAPGLPLPSSADSRDALDPGRYRSPFSGACRPVTVGLATAAAASADAGAPEAARRLPGFDAPDCGSGCLVEILRWMSDSDVLPTSTGRQFAAVQVARPGGDDASSLALSRAAWTGAIDLRDPLAAVLLLTRALEHDAADGAGASVRVSAPAFLRADGTLLFALSEPRHRPRWLGNLRRYRLAPGASATAAPPVVDADGRLAFDPATGRPLPDSRSLWSQVPDGAAAILGGAAGRLPSPSERILLSDLTSSALGTTSTRVSADNPLLTRETLGLAPTDPRTLGELVQWLLGVDSFDADGDGDRLAPRGELGDPGARPPAVVRDASGAATAFLLTADGLLHAIDVDTGVERWGFLPAPLLARAAALAASRETVARVPGEPGGLAVSLDDGNGDGLIDPALGESAQVVFGFGRQGTGYYALDVSQPAAPALRWSLSADELPGFGESWPEPVVVPMNIDRSLQSPGQRVVVLAGGYDPAERIGDLPEADPGAALVIVDADTGELLWGVAGRGSPHASVIEPAMRHSFPSAPRLVDRDGDGFADLLYAVDLKGQLWRIDVPSLAAGTSAPEVRMVADLAAPGAPGERRFFFHTPDAVFETLGDRPRIVVALGSGRLSRPRETRVVDRFHAVFDELEALPSGSPALTTDDLEDVTDATIPVPVDAHGWLRRLDQHGPGEKAVGTGVTFDHRLRFTTHQPQPPLPDAPCGPPQARNRLYTLDIRTGRAAHRIGDEEAPPEELAGDGLPVDLRIVAPNLFGEPCTVAGCSAPVLFHGGLGRTIEFTNRLRKTSWRQLEAPAE